MQTINKTIYLPKKVTDFVDETWGKENLTKPQKKKRVKALRFMAYLFSKQHAEDSYVEIPSTYLLKLFNSQYLSIVNPFRKHGIIRGFETESSKDSYITPSIDRLTQKYKTGKCKKYQLTEDYFVNLFKLEKEELEEIDIKFEVLKKSKKSKSYYKKKDVLFEEVVLEYKTRKGSEDYERDFLKSINSLIIDEEKLVKKTRNVVDNIDVKNLEIFKSDFKDDQLNKYKKTLFISKKNRRTYNMKLSDVFKKASISKKRVFSDNNNVYVSNYELFTAYKKDNTYESYINSIKRLKQGNLYAKRNNNNGRLDTNITNLPNVLLDVIKKDNNLVSYDLCNSQFSILSHILDEKGVKNTEDVVLFKKLAYSGKLYDYIAEKRGITRSESKVGFFEINFDKVGKKSKDKEYLNKLFPNVIKFVDDFKTKYGYKKLALLLQLRESNIFIDGLYNKIMDRVGFVLTKHDSVIFRQEDEEVVKEIIKEHFEKLNFNGKMIKE